jgi:outer membrane protein TolC
MKKITIIILSVFWLSSIAQVDTTKTVFSLSEAQEYALMSNKQVVNAKLDIIKAKKKIWETTAMGLPQVGATAGHNYNIDLPVTLMPAQIFNPAAPEGEYMEMKFGTDHNTKFNLQATQLIFSGEYIVGLKASKIYKELSENQLEKTEKELKQQIANTYELILIAQERKNIIEKNIENTQSIFDDTKAMYESGLAQETDASQLQINLTSLENALTSAERQIDIVKNLLKFQMNIPLKKEITLSDKLEPMLETLNIEEIQNTEFNVEQHFDYKLIATQEHLQELNMDREKTTFLPSISAFYNHQESMMSNDFEVFSGGKWYPANIIGLSINIPIFSSGQRLSKVSQQQIELDKVQNSKYQLSESLNMQVIQARLEFQNAYDSYNLQKQNKDLSEKIYNNYETKYKEGMASSLELTQSQLQYLNTEQAYFQAIFNLLDAKNKLDKALGL